VLSGSDGTLKMWDIRDGTQVRDLLTGIVGVWQVVFEGRWCVAASNRLDSTVLDVWDFGNDEADDEWTGEPSSGMYDEETDEEDDEIEQGDLYSMDQDLDMVPSDTEEVETEDPDVVVEDEEEVSLVFGNRVAAAGSSSSSATRDDVAQPVREHDRHRATMRRPVYTSRNAAAGSSSSRARTLPINDETPTRPRMRHTGHRRR